MSLPLRILCFATIALYFAFAALLVFINRDDADSSGTPLGFDFSAYYEAAQFARHGEAAKAYDDRAFIAAEQARFPQSTTKLPWNYPPIFQAILLPFSLLPYVAAFAFWSTLLLAAHIAFTRRLVGPSLLWPLLLFPGAILNLFLGASGLLVALFIGVGFLLLEKRPLSSGFLFALALFKPHLALLIPVALIASKQYRALVGMLAGAVLLFLGTTMVFGSASWLAFFAKAMHASDVVLSSSSDWTRVPTIYTLLKVLGLPGKIAGFVHLLVALTATGAVAWMWRANAKPALGIGALALGLLIVTPYARVYDLALLIFPIVALLEQTKDHVKLDRFLLSLAWIAPLIGLLVELSTPWVSLLLPVLLARLVMRARLEVETQHG